MSFNKRAFKWIKENQDIRYVVISSSMGVLENTQYSFLTSDEVIPYNLEYVKKNLSTAVDALVEAEKKVIFVSPLPRDNRDIGKCLTNAQLFKGLTPNI